MFLNKQQSTYVRQVHEQQYWTIGRVDITETELYN